MSAVIAVQPHLSNIRPPEALRKLPGWVVWRYEHETGKVKPKKVPYYSGGGKRFGDNGSARDRAKLTTFDAAVAAAIRGNFDGVGLAILPEFGLIALDFDNCVKGDTLDTIERLVAGTYAEYSPSGQGVRAFMRGVLPNAKDAKNVLFGLEVFSSSGYVTFTGNRLQVTDLCGAENSILELTDEVRSLYVERFGDPSAPRALTPADPLGVDTETLQRALDAIDPDIDHDTWLRVGMALHHEAKSEVGFALWNKWSAKGEKYPGEATMRQRWKSFNKHGDRQVTVRTLMQIANQFGADINIHVTADDFDVVSQGGTAAEDKKPLPPLARDKNGRPEAVVGNLLAVLRRPDVTGMQLGFDQFRDELMWTVPGKLEWRPFKDTDYMILRELLEARPLMFKPIGRELIRDAVAKVADENQFDSAIAWLESLRWDGVPRVANFLRRYFGVDDTPYHRAVALYLWTALAGRILSPGCKADMVPVLVGAQGLRKSTAVAALAPNPEYFTEISFADRDADLSRKMRGTLVAEIAELRGLNSRDMEWIKAFITMTHERWTPKYKEFETTFARRLVFVATTNEDEFLADQTGNRRWLPVRVGKADVEALQVDLLQLWSEAAELFKYQGVAWLDAERLATGVHADHMIRDVWEGPIREWLQVEDVDGEKPATRNFLRTGEILRGALGFDPKNCGKREEMRVAACMRALGYRKTEKWVGGKSAKVWALPPLST